VEEHNVDKQVKAQMYFDYLSQEGFRPEIDKEGDVCFNCEGRSYFVQVDEADASFFRICFPNFWTIENQEERHRVLAACDFANRRSKAAKIFTVADDTWGAIEIFVETPGAFKGVFQRCMSALQNAVRNFVENMRAERSPSSEVADGPQHTS
jgi:hypothetical protein